MKLTRNATANSSPVLFCLHPSNCGNLSVSTYILITFHCGNLSVSTYILITFPGCCWWGALNSALRTISRSSAFFDFLYVERFHVTTLFTNDNLLGPYMKMDIDNVDNVADVNTSDSIANHNSGGCICESSNSSHPARRNAAEWFSVIAIKFKSLTTETD